MHQIAAFYKFSQVQDVEQLVADAKHLCQSEGITGTLLVAGEGVNGTMSALDKSSLDKLLLFLAQRLNVNQVPAKFSHADKPPFRRLKVKPKAEIVAMGVDGVQPGSRTGIEAEPALWNEVISDPDTIVIDTRNAYEIAIGSFPGAVDPKTATFRDFPTYVKEELEPLKGKKRIAMFCTGGIRCEKASSYLMDEGFGEVYQLSGGVLGYFEKAAKQGVENKWVGDCFVFDDRVAVTKQLEPSGHEMCPVCRHPLSADDLADERTDLGTSCLHCYGNRSAESIASAQERYRQVLLAKDRGFIHLAPNMRVDDAPADDSDQNVETDNSDPTTEFLG